MLAICCPNPLSSGRKHSFPHLLRIWATGNAQLSLWDLLLVEARYLDQGYPHPGCEGNPHTKVGSCEIIKALFLPNTGQPERAILAAEVLMELAEASVEIATKFIFFLCSVLPFSLLYRYWSQKHTSINPSHPLHLPNSVPQGVHPGDSICNIF